MSIDAAALQRWRVDPVAFAEEACILRRPDDTLGPPILSERQKSWLQALAARDREGPKYKTIVVIAPKRSGKTLLGGIALLWKTALAEDRRSVCLANSRESAQSLGFSVAADLVKRGPLAGAATIERGRIAFPGIGSEILALPCSSTVAGIGVTGLLLSDELWAAASEEPYRLLHGQADAVEAQVLVVSQASGLGSEVYRLYQAGQLDPPVPGLYVDYVTPEELRAGLQLSPARTAKYLAHELATMIDAVYRHYHENEWGEAGGTFLTPEILAGCNEDFDFPRNSLDWTGLCNRFAAQGRVIVAGGLDRALPYSGRDSTVFVVIAAFPTPDKAEPTFRIVACTVIPTGAEAEVLAAVRKTDETFRHRVPMIAEVYQCADIAPRLGVASDDLRPATTQAQVSGFTAIHRAAADGRLKWPAGPDGDLLREQFGRLRVDTSGPQPKFSGGKAASVDDAAYAAMWALTKAGEITPVMFTAAPRDLTPSVTQGYTGGAGDDDAWIGPEPIYEFGPDE